MPVSLSFEFNFESEEELTPHDVRTAHLYVFHKDNGRFVSSWIFQNPSFDHLNKAGITLLPGLYDFVLWFNQETPFYTVPPYADFARNGVTGPEAQLKLDLAYWKDDISAPLLLYGHLENAEIQLNKANTFVVPVTLNTHLIHFTVKGLPYNTDTYRFAVTDHNGAYTFGNDFAPFQQFDYGVTVRFPSPQSDLSAAVSVLKLHATRSPKISLRNGETGKALYPQKPEDNDNLVRLILDKYPNIDFSRQYRFDVTLSFGQNMTVAVEVEAWNYKEDDYTVHPE